MLKNTFIHLPGIGFKTENSLWEKGIHSWEMFCDETGCRLTPFGRKKHEYLKTRLEDCHSRLLACDPAFFANSLPTQQYWRLFPDFRKSTAYLDIETTGLGGPDDYITTVALYDGENVFHYVHGVNMDYLPEDLRKYKVLITYNGSCFDLPFIRGYFGIQLEHVHIDLRFLLSSLGYRGGLKGCEKKLGIDRKELDGVDGFFAVLLWDEYRKSRNPNALETLLAYNIADAVNLETLMVLAYNLKLNETPFSEQRLSLPCPPAVDFHADSALVSRLRERCFGFETF